MEQFTYILNFHVYIVYFSIFLKANKISSVYTQFKKLGEHIFQTYAMLDQTIPQTQAYYQLNLYPLPLECATEHRWIRVHFQKINEMSKYGQKQSDKSPPEWSFISSGGL